MRKGRRGLARGYNREGLSRCLGAKNQRSVILASGLLLGDEGGRDRIPQRRGGSVLRVIAVSPRDCGDEKRQRAGPGAWEEVTCTVSVD